MVVHVDLLPDAPGQEGHGILVPGRRAGDGDLAVGIGPLPAGHLRAAGAVVDLIVGQRVGAIVEDELLVEVAVHQTDGEGVALGGHRVGDEEGLLLGVGMGRGELVVLADDADGGINAVARVGDLARELGAVAVADHVRAPLLRQLQRQLLIARLARQGKAALAVFCLAHGSHSLHKLVGRLRLTARRPPQACRPPAPQPGRPAPDPDPSPGSSGGRCCGSRRDPSSRRCRRTRSAPGPRG